jgi:hypothetical protein
MDEAAPLKSALVSIVVVLLTLLLEVLLLAATQASSKPTFTRSFTPPYSTNVQFPGKATDEEEGW